MHTNVQYRLPRRLSGKRIHLLMQRAWVPSLGGEDPWQKEMATHSSILAWEIPWTEEPSGATVHRVTKQSDTT